MDKRTEKQLLEWYEESTDDELASEPDPYSDDGEFNGDADYVPSTPSRSESEEENSLVEGPNEISQVVTVENENEFENEDSSSDVLDENQPNQNNLDENDIWEEVTSDIPNFQFDVTQTGIKIAGIENMSPINVFEQLWDQNITDLILTSTNNYGKMLYHTNRPKTRHSRSREFKPILEQELKIFFGLCLLQGQIKTPDN